MNALREDFTGEPGLHWRRYIAGNGVLEPSGSTLRLVVSGATARRYSDAQIDDYQGLPRRRFPWRPPLRLAVRARFSHPAADDAPVGIATPAAGLRGTAGFGFWNDPFLMTGARVPVLPRAIWFFYGSPPSDMKLDLQTPGHGWKAATIDALRPVALLLAPLAPSAVLLMNVRSLYRVLWPSIQRALNVREAAVGVDMSEWHTYVIEWEAGWTHFAVDGETILGNAPSPRGPLGFVMWMDNQYMVVTPWGRLKWGLLDVPGSQWMEVDWFTLESKGGRSHTGV